MKNQRQNPKSSNYRVPPVLRKRPTVFELQSPCTECRDKTEERMKREGAMWMTRCLFWDESLRVEALSESTGAPKVDYWFNSKLLFRPEDDRALEDAVSRCLKLGTVEEMQASLRAHDAPGHYVPVSVVMKHSPKPDWCEGQVLLRITPLGEEA